MKIYFGTPQFGCGIPQFFADNCKIVAVFTYKITYIYVLYIKFFINNFADVKPECNFFKKTDEVVETGVKCDKTWQKQGQKTNRSSMCKNNNRDTGTPLPSRQTIVQPKLELTTPGDSYEREADRMADFVMRRQYTGIPTEMPSVAYVVHPTISRNISGSAGVAVDTATEGGINASRGGGQPMPEALRSQMESGFGADFSGVRLHTDSRAADLSRGIQAKAFTYGNDIYFNRGQYSPDTTAGQHLIAHELTHVVQQSGKVGRETNKSQNDILDIIQNNLNKIKEDPNQLVNMIIQNLNESNFEKLLENNKRFFGDFIIDHPEDFHVLFNRFPNTIKKHIPYLKYLKSRPDFDDYYNGYNKVESYYSELSVENLLVLNMLTYLPHRHKEDGRDTNYIRDKIFEAKEKKLSVRVFIESLNSPNSWKYEENETISKEDWNDLFNYILINDIFNYIIIKDAQTDNYGDESNCYQTKDDVCYKEKQFSILFFNKLSKEAIVAFRGTGLDEWKDNFRGAVANSTDGQKKALYRYQEYHKLLDLDEDYYSKITVTGHSKGGNKAKYITIKDESVDRCVSFDGQGFSDAFISDINNNRQEIDRSQKIVNYNTDKDFVNILLNDIGDTHYLQSKNYDSDKSNNEKTLNLESHSPEVMLNFLRNRYSRTSVKLAEIGEQNKLMVELDKFLNSYIRTLSKIDKSLMDASISLIGNVVYLLMKNNHSRKLNFLATYLNRKGKSHDNEKKAIAFLLVFLYFYSKTNSSFTESLPINPDWFCIIPHIPDLFKKLSPELDKKTNKMINKEDISYYMELFKHIKIENGDDKTINQSKKIN